MTDAPPPAPRTPFQQELYKARMEAFYESSSSRGRFVIDFAMLGLRSLVLVNGGAIIAMLTFLGHHKDMAVRGSLWDGFYWLLWGLGSALATIILAYIAQQYFTLQDSASAETSFYDSHGEKDADVKRWKQKAKDSWQAGRRLQIAAVIVALASFACFCVGCYITLDALIDAAASPLI